jgi:hypothetical protein
MIVETTDNRLFSVHEIPEPDLAHVWFGIPVKRAKIRGTYEARANAKPELVRKEGSKVVSSFRVEV